MEEVELGGLEDEEDDTLAAGIEEEEEEFLFDKEVSFISFVLYNYVPFFLAGCTCFLFKIGGSCM